FSREGFEQGLEKFLRHTVGKIPKSFACRRRYEGRNIEPVETMMAWRDWTLPGGRPDTARDRLQADPVLVRGEDLNRFARMLRSLLCEGVRELFLKAAASSGVAGFGFFGRGVWIDQPIAFRASLAFAAPDNPLSRNASLCPSTRLPARQPRCGATDLRPSSSAIQ